MAEEKTFRVYAKVITYSYIDIKAKSAEEAEQKAEDQMSNEELDGGDFYSVDDGGEFELAPVYKPTHEVEEYYDK